jgi:hypothetical protein
VELAIEKSGNSAEKLLCMVKLYEYRYRAQEIGSNNPSQIQYASLQARAIVIAVLRLLRCAPP